MTQDLNLFRDDCALHLGRLPESIPLVNRMGGILVTVEQVIDAVKKAFRGTCSFLKRFRASFA